jgi:cobalt-zinc-cadmium efflux system outer membrane protein
VESDLLSRRGEEARLRGILAALLGLPAENLVAEDRLDRAGTLPGLEEVRTLAASRGDLVALEAEADRADALARASHRRAIPEPTLTVGAKSTETAGLSDTGSLISISFSLPIFDRGQGGRRVALAEGELLRAQRDLLARQARSEAEAALAEVSARRGAAEAYAEAGDPADLARIARAAYEAGEMRILELLDAYRTELTVRLRMIDLQADARRAEIQLDRVMGREVVR